MYTPFRGVGNNSWRIYRNLSAIGASIVTRHASRTLTGNCLYLNIHQHLWYSVHVTWWMKYHSVADRCFARCFDTDDECNAFCKKLKKSTIDGLCDCKGHKWNICYGPWIGYTVTIFTAYRQSKPWTNQSGSGASWRAMASSDVGVLYHLRKGSSTIGF
jgi:hypothetical protein